MDYTQLKEARIFNFFLLWRQFIRTTEQIFTSSMLLQSFCILVFLISLLLMRRLFSFSVYLLSYPSIIAHTCYRIEDTLLLPVIWTLLLSLLLTSRTVHAPQYPFYLDSLVAQWERFHLPNGRCRFNPWVGKMPWRRTWQPTPVFLLGKSNEQRSLAGYSPRGHKSQTQFRYLTKTLILSKVSVCLFHTFVKFHEFFL